MKYRSIKKPLLIDGLKGKKIAVPKEKAIPSKSTAVESNIIYNDIEENTSILQEIFSECSDITYRKFVIANGAIKCLLIYVNGITNNQDTHENILKSMIKNDYSRLEEDIINDKESINIIKDSILTVGDIKLITTMNDVVNSILDGNCVLLVDRNTNALSMGTKAWESRGVEKPESEVTVRGPMEAFNENIMVNTVLVRRRVKSSSLKIEQYVVGEVSKTKVNIIYIKGKVENKTIDEVRNKITAIKTDSILDSGEIEPYLEDQPLSPFPQTGVTERPDTVAAALNEGRVAILVDGSPFILIVPTVFVHFLTASEDYYERFYFASLVRILRYFAFTIALLGPSVYVALTTFHQEMIPRQLLTSIASSRANVPFPAIVEALLMEIMFEILREAGIRLPRPVGQAISIVGALVIGDTAVQAGLAAPTMVLVVALTGIASFTIPAYNAAISVRIVKFWIMLFAATLGIYGVILSVLIILFHMSSLTSVGVPYLSPVSPVKFEEWRDVFVRLPKSFSKKKA